jgi:hypothetical protein
MRLHHDPKPWKPKRPDPNCVCGKPLAMVIRPGEHVHPCPVHPDNAVYGPAEVYC